MSKQQKMQDEITKTITALLKDNKPILPFIKDNRKETKHIFSLTIDTADTDTLQYYYDTLPENIYHIKEYAQTLSKILSKKQQKIEDSNFSIKNLVSNMRAVILKNKRINDDGHISALFVELSYHNKDYKQYEYLNYAYQWLSYTNKLPNKSTLRKYFVILAGLFLKNHMFANYLNCIYRIHMLAKFNVNINFIRRVSKIVSYKNEKASKYFIGLSYKSAAEIVEYFEKDERKSMKEEEKIKHSNKDEETKNEEKNTDNKRTYKDEADNMEDDFDNEADFAKEDNVCEDNTKQSMSHLLEFDFTYYDMLENGFNELDVKFISFLNLNNFTYKIEEDKVVDIKNEDRSLTTRIYDIIEEMRSKQKKNAIVEEVKEEKKEKKIKVQPVIKKKAKPKKKKNNYFDKEYNLFRMHSRNLFDFVPDQQDTHFEGRVEKANKLYNKEMEELIFVKNMVESAGDLEEMMKVISQKIEKENEERMKMKTESMREGTSVGGFRRGTKMGVINVESKGANDVYDPSKSRTQERFRNTSMYDNNESRGQRSYEQKPGYSRDQSITEISQSSTEGARKFVRGQRSNEFGSTEIHDIQRSVRDLKLDETHKIGREQASSEPANINSEETKFVRGSKLQANIDSENVQSERTVEKKAFVRGSQMNNFREDDRSRQMDAPPAREAYARRTTDFDSNYGAERQSRGDGARSYTRGSKVNEERPEYTNSRASYRSNPANETTISDREQNYNTARENADETRTRQPFVRGSKINSTTERESSSDRRFDNSNRNASNSRKSFDDERTSASDRWRGNLQTSNFERGSKLTTSQRSETTQGQNNDGHTPRNSYRGRSNERDGKKDHDNTSPVSDRKNSLGNTDDKKSTDDSSKGSFKGSFKRGSKFNN